MISESKESQSLEATFNAIGFGKFHVVLIFASGCLQAFDAMELLILAFLGPILTCQWQISVIQESFLTTGVFIGALFGGIFFGTLCDKYGRKAVLIVNSIMLMFVGMMCAFSPVIEWLIILRTVIGVCLGGIMVSLSTLTSELMPLNFRGISLMIILGFWSLGSYLITTLSMLIVPHYGWRIFLLISTLPLLCTIPILVWLPESPRFLLLRNKKSEAIQIMNKIAKMNNSPVIKDILQLDKPKNSKNGFFDLWHPNYWLTTILTNLLWIISGISYYSIILMVTVMNEVPHQCYQNWDTQSNTFTRINASVDDSCCMGIVFHHYKEAYISTTGELLFLLLSIILLAHLPRKVFMGASSLVISVCFISMNFCMPSGLSSVLLLVTRGSIFLVFNLNYIYTSEVFPTSTRSFALGLCNCSARIGSMLSPFVVYVLMARSSFLAGTCLLSGLNILAFIIILLMPYETKNRILYQTTQIENETKIDLNKEG